jgi:small neutral amino acid transporter SnatA (MarC family)
VLALGLAWGIVGLPERCPAVSPADAEGAAVETVDWFARNQLPDGRWVYRYNLDRDQVDLQPHTVRHSGVTMSLYQAHDAGISGALDIADTGTEWALSHLLEHDDWAAVAPTRQVPTGGTALLLAGLAIRRAATDDPRYDDEMRGMARFLESMTEPSGAVLAVWDTDAGRPVPGVYSQFFTGEAYFALALLAQVDPGGGWDATVDRIGEYLATERDQAEEIFPPLSDHWAAYGLAASTRGGARPLTDTQRDYAQRLAGIFSVQVRYESQRTGDGINRWVLRGPRALPAGVGTLGEGLGSLWQLTEHDDVLASDRDAIGERLRCVAGMLVDRQKDAADAAETARPDLVQGAWFRLGWTQKDDQQHALSALLLALPALAESGSGSGSSGGDSLGRTLWLVVIAVALVNPLRVRRLASHAGGAAPAAGQHRRQALAGAIITAACLAAVAALAAPLLRAIDVSPPTALIAAGLVVGLTAVGDFIRPKVEPWASAGGGSGPLALTAPVAVPGLLRPAAVLLVLAVAADVRVATGLAVALAVTACAVAALRPPTRGPGVLDTVLWRAVAAVAILGAIDLIVDGIFAL